MSLSEAFPALMAPLGPFEPAPLLAAAVSGGADSMALALLARDWARARGGDVAALVVDHGLRAASAAEARLAMARLAAEGIAARLLPLTGLAPGPGLARRARAARYAALERACGEAGMLHLLLAHHAADQAETVVQRLYRGSGAAGLAGMAALVETDTVRLLRPLLTVAPAALRELLRARGVAWVEDPSNADVRATRGRLRQLRADCHGRGPVTRALTASAGARGCERAAREGEIARILAGRVRFHPEGYAVLSAGPIAPDALAAVLRVLGGRAHPPAPAAVAALATAPRPATLGGVRIMPAGRHGPPGALLLVREAAAVAPPVAAGARWDGRYTVAGPAPAGAMLGALGMDRPAADERRAWRRLPAAVRRTMPALRANGKLFAPPAIGYAAPHDGVRLLMRPPAPACPAAFMSAMRGPATRGPAMHGFGASGDAKACPDAYVDTVPARDPPGHA